ncbi:hypothetical protein [Endozoicomonas euniceicola]|uniref:Uncharacterized protein n=1 Tax=Endozoicomonas euniceicola TaxID=1234143 RepID=A0ABY6GXK8_9GAMM|nr:hypothetical protein [Endozoicomonas euniceicola]UYM17519.1 hypothetical protein NX720_06275 [Endozoicomonas euniceicola]
MLYYPDAGGGEFNLEYPLQDSKLGCTPYEYNITYVMPEIPDDAGHIILTQVVQYDFLVITTYCYPLVYDRRCLCPENLRDKLYYFYILHDEKNHCRAMHKRSSPSSFHMHLGVEKCLATDLWSLYHVLYYLFLPIESFQSTSVDNSKHKSADQLIYAVRYLVNHPEQPGINFENGHYALRDGYNPDSAYFHGPYKLMTVP